jgi:tripeptide aminopeptidase
MTESMAASVAPSDLLRQRVGRLVALTSVHTAFDWFSDNTRQIGDWQLEVTEIPAPPFAETRRAEWVRQRFIELGLKEVHLDSVGNVVGIRPGRDAGAKFTAMCAHLDTVFPHGTAIKARREDGRLYGPGISDNSSGLVALLALASAMKEAKLQTESPLVFLANVGEEGEGDLRGMRAIFGNPRWRDSIAYTLVLDGGGTESLITEGIGSRRFLVTVRGPGGHSWSDFGAPNPILILARAIDLFSRTPISTPPPRSAFNIGVISGGTSVNSIPETASMKVDLRSAAAGEIDRLEQALRDALNRAVSEYHPPPGHKFATVSYDADLIGNRPAATLKTNAWIAEVIRAVDVQLGIVTRVQRASTDANVPLALGREAVAIGAGGTGGDAHTLHEWFDPANRELGLRRILLSALVLSGPSE